MPTLSILFNLNKNQSELDFVDIDPSRDKKLFLDPFALSIRDDDWSTQCTDQIVSFFDAVIEAIRTKDATRARMFLSHLGEPNETCLGLSKGNPRGRGVGSLQASDLYRSLSLSKAAKTGELRDLAEAELFVEGFGPDKISDITTNVIRSSLIEYTHDQCETFGIPVRKNVAMNPFWNAPQGRWESTYADVPVFNERPILLVPKYSVRLRMSLDSQEFYNHQMLDYLKAEHLEANSSLVHVLKNNERRVYKTDLKRAHPFSKDALFDFAREHPQVVELYRTIKGAQGALADDDLVQGFDEKLFARLLASRLKSIPAGAAAAHEYEDLCIGLFQFLFYPALVYPRKQSRIHDGRKIVDISYTNAAREGFFERIAKKSRIPSHWIYVECKNFSHDPKNPEIDQLSGRFSPNRTRFGILVARTFDNKDLFLERCRDTVKDDRGFVVPLDDGDILEMLHLISQGERRQIDHLLNSRFEQITH